jgi:hypothetical protein
MRNEQKQIHNDKIVIIVAKIQQTKRKYNKRHRVGYMPKQSY